jgi:hypothetical protein
MEPSSLNVHDLRIELKKRNLSPTGAKIELINRLNLALRRNNEESKDKEELFSFRTKYRYHRKVEVSESNVQQTELNKRPVFVRPLTVEEDLRKKETLLEQQNLFFDSVRYEFEHIQKKRKYLKNIEGLVKRMNELEKIVSQQNEAIKVLQETIENKEIEIQYLRKERQLPQSIVKDLVAFKALLN